MNSLLRAVTAALLLMFLIGCGQSGPLYVPGNPSTVHTQQGQQEVEQEQEEEDEEDSAEDETE